MHSERLANPTHGGSDAIILNEPTLAVDEHAGKAADNPEDTT